MQIGIINSSHSDFASPQKYLSSIICHPFSKNSLFVQAITPSHFKPEHRLPPPPFCRHWHLCGLTVNSWNSSSCTPTLAENSQLAGQVNSNVGTRWHCESAVGCRTSFLSGVQIYFILKLQNQSLYKPHWSSLLHTWIHKCRAKPTNKI